MHFNELEAALYELQTTTEDDEITSRFARLHSIMADLSRKRVTLDEQTDKTKIAEFRERLFPVVHQSTFCKYVYDKPRGYAGDYVTQEMIWLGRTQGGKYLYDGRSRLGELINAFTFDMANCIANEERIYRLREYIARSGPRLMSIGCGSCIELGGYQSDAEECLQVLLIDQDEAALSRAKMILSQTSGLQPIFKHTNVLKYILGKSHMECGPRDLIYLFGLMDYFPVNSAKRLVQVIWPCVASGGMLVLTNAHPANPTRMWMEYVGDWFLDYKTEEMMVSLADGLPNAASVDLVKDSEGVYQYLEIQAS